MLFDYKFYTSYYKDLKELSVLDASNHFNTYGINEKRIFNERLINFDYKFYIEYYNDLKELSFLEGCNHFLKHGIEKELIFNEKLINFDYKFYIEYYNDLKELSFLDACNQFLTNGISENRLINNNVETYYLKNVELKYNNDTINNLKFLHITKTGGTSIEEFAIKLGIKWGKYDKVLLKQYKKEGFWHIPLSYFETKTINKYNWFTIIRNPYERVISEVNFLLKKEHIQYNKVDINLYLNNILSNLLIDKNTINNEFVEKNDIMFAFHFIPIYFYTCLDSNEKIIPNLKIIKFENLNEELNSYFQQLNIEEEFNIHENKNEQKCFEFEDLSIKNIKLINKVYKIDFNLFNYKIISY